VRVPAWFWPWAAWKDHGSPLGERPPSAPKRIPAWAWARYALHRPPPPPVLPPVRLQSVFAGRGMFTVERPQDAAWLRLDWQLDAIASTCWLSRTHLVYQAETPDELATALQDAGHPLWGGTGEKALVSNLYMGEGEWPDGWTCMPECYWNADGGEEDNMGYPRGRAVPNMIYRAKQVIGPERWGTIPVVPVVGCYDASGENPGVGVRLTLPDYLPDLEAAMREYPCVVGYAIWRVETLDPRDREALA
jgi:hypothetical protein